MAQATAFHVATVCAPANVSLSTRARDATAPPSRCQAVKGCSVASADELLRGGFFSGAESAALRGAVRVEFPQQRWRRRTRALRVAAQKTATLPVALEAGEVPLHLFKNKEPYIATVKSVERIVGPNAPGEVCHIVIDHGGNMPYWEGQSYGVIPPGENPKRPGTPHTVRLYSIASTRYGDEFDGKTASLCVRRALYIDPETGKEDPSKKGVCSNFLCDAKPGDKIQLTGPAGKVMLLPEEDPNANHIMVATGTGIAPYRAYLRRMFMEDVPTFKYGGKAWLFLGVANRDALLYDEEFQSYLKKYPENFRYSTALSREENNRSGGKMYIQDKMEEHSTELFDLLEGGAHIYFCGLKGMMPGIIAMLKRVAESKGLDWDERLGAMKKDHRWHVEVY
ncbi:hypothetical protein CBR_g19271 [Chara braunii]|uniref:Ferredoxin--NADP reductase, chloroplastic n=1 Tax=Chara braunii TaxID=69332 RepID=A0A388KXL6_CHABU|nr:hypothetical protein CBR_g19271 [Chara braunii]|eukprot:GBG74758.1 hypothetical protein CBR_g19271 [Chara braunii]